VTNVKRNYSLNKPAGKGGRNGGVTNLWLTVLYSHFTLPGRATPQAVSYCGGSDSVPGQAGTVLEKVELGQAIFQEIRFTPANNDPNTFRVFS
jgi:hypothetical protein